MASSLTALLGIARDGAVAQQAALQTTGENIANASTPGYVRRAVVMSARSGFPNGPGGVDVTRTTRAFDGFVTRRVLDEQGKLSAGQSREGALAQIQGIVAPETGSVGDQIEALAVAFQQLVGFPGDLAVRGNVLSKAESVAQTFHDTAASLLGQRDDLFRNAQGVASDLNQRLVAIGDLNAKIAQAKDSPDGGAGLRDQRDQLVREVGQRIGARVVEDPSTGAWTLFGGGTVLIDAERVSSVDVGLDPTGNLQIQARRPGGALIDMTTKVVEGSLGGLREARDTDLVSAQTKLDALAFDFASSINVAHSAGFGLDGVSGRPLFATSATATGAAYAMTLDPAVAGRPGRLAASATAIDVPGGNGAALSIVKTFDANLPTSGLPPRDTFAALGADIGTRLSSASAEIELRQGTLGQVDSLRESQSGVSVEEEMVDLTRFQRAFEASIKVLRTVDELLDQLIQSKR
ncbi:MAG: flagellar hook-associated protein FlgK [Myxococcales bacterium]|nr:flagellar hook-associated protein FlgK [Myxococcales bacterium]